MLVNQEMHTPQNTESMRAMAMKNKPPLGMKRRRKAIIPFGTIIHKNGKPFSGKREILVDRSIYTGDLLREIRRQNGVGKGLKQIAIRDARKARRAAGDLRTEFIREADLKRAKAAVPA